MSNKLDLVLAIRALCPTAGPTPADVATAAHILAAMSAAVAPEHEPSLAFFQRAELAPLRTAIGDYEQTWRARESSYGLMLAVAVNGEEIKSLCDREQVARGDFYRGCVQALRTADEDTLPGTVTAYATAFHHMARRWRDQLLSPAVHVAQQPVGDVALEADAA